MDERLLHDRRVTLLLLTVLVVAVSYLFARGLDSEYAGFAALLAIPMSIGALASHAGDPEGRASPLKIVLLPIAVIGAMTAVGWLVFREGAICIAMVLPIWLPAAVAGALVNGWNARRTRRANDVRLLSVGWLALPFFVLLAEQPSPPPWQEQIVTRSIDVPESAEELWPLVVSIPAITATEGRPNLTQDLLGVPRPSEARLVQVGGRWVRKATWGDTIRFEEEVVAVAPYRRLAWHFRFPDDSIQRHTDRHVSPDGPMLKIISGEYRLEPLPGEGTRLVLETRYRMRSRFAPYLRLWGEQMLGDVQSNILEVLKQRSRTTMI